MAGLAVIELALKLVLPDDVRAALLLTLLMKLLMLA